MAGQRTAFFLFKKFSSSITQIRGGSIKPWMEHVRVLLGKMKPELNAALQNYSQNTVAFPQPLDGTVSEISPLAFIWEPMPTAVDYRIEIKDKHEDLIYQKILVVIQFTYQTRYYVLGLIAGTSSG